MKSLPTLFKPCVIGHGARALYSSHTSSLYQRKIQEAEQLVDKCHIEQAKNILRGLWKAYPDIEDAYIFHANLVMQYSLSAYKTELKEIMEQKRVFFPEKAADAKKWFKENYTSPKNS